MKKSSILLSIFCLLFLQQTAPVSALERGFNTVRINELDQDDFNDMRQFYGASLVRLSFAPTPLYDYDESTFTWRRNQQNFALLNQKLLEIKRAGLVAVVDPHRVFATANIYTLRTDSKFWQDARHGEAWADAVADLAGYLDKSPYQAQVWGIDLINEPSALAWRKNRGAKEGTPDRYTQTDINLVYQDMIYKVRKNNKKHRLIVMFFEDDFKDGTVKSPSFYLSKLPNSDKSSANSKLYFSSHIYWPSRFTHQGIQNRAGGRTWPGGSYETEKNLDKRMKWITDWQSKYGVNSSRIFIGEWGLSQGNNLAWNGNTSNPSNGGRQWMDQVSSHISKYHWTVHQYGGNPLFNINNPPARRQYVQSLIKNPSQTIASAPRSTPPTYQDPSNKEACFSHKSTGRLLAFSPQSSQKIITSTEENSQTSWKLVDAGSGYYRIQHEPTGRLLHYNTKTPQFVNTATGLGSNTQWKLINAGPGFYHIQHKTTGRLIHYNGSQFVNTGTGRGANTQWNLSCE